MLDETAGVPVNEKARSNCPNLPGGWVREVVTRKSGASVGRCDIYYYSPEGKKCRSKPQIAQYLPDGVRLDGFDFRSGDRVVDMEQASKCKRRRDDFNFGKDFVTASGTGAGTGKLNRQKRQADEGIKIVGVTSTDMSVHDEASRNAIAEQAKRSQRVADVAAKRKRAEQLSQRVATRPRQLFWQRRLQGLRPVDDRSKQTCKSIRLDDIVKDLLPGSNEQAMLNSVAFALFNNSSKVYGQQMFQMSQSALRKNPGVWCNAEQPFCAPFTVSDEALREQEKRTELTRRRLAEAQDLLNALEQEHSSDDDDDDE